jgi:hypothetical protein
MRGECDGWSGLALSYGIREMTDGERGCGDLRLANLGWGL